MTVEGLETEEDVRKIPRYVGVYPMKLSGKRFSLLKSVHVPKNIDIAVTPGSRRVVLTRHLVAGRTVCQGAGRRPYVSELIPDKRLIRTVRLPLIENNVGVIVMAEYIPVSRSNAEIRGKYRSRAIQAAYEVDHVWFLSTPRPAKLVRDAQEYDRRVVALKIYQVSQMLFDLLSVVRHVEKESGLRFQEESLLVCHIVVLFVPRSQNFNLMKRKEMLNQYNK